MPLVPGQRSRVLAAVEHVRNGPGDPGPVDPGPSPDVPGERERRIVPRWAGPSAGRGTEQRPVTPARR